MNRYVRISISEHILAVHRLTFHPITFGADDHVLVCGGAGDRGAHSVAVVLDDEDDGQVPQRCNVQRFVKRADVHSGFPEGADTDLVSAAVFDRESNACRDWNVAADDSVSAEEVGLRIEKVHGSAFAAGAPGFASEKLRHDCSRADSARQRLAVIAVSGDDVVIGPDHGHDAGRDRFLADVQVTEPANFSQRVCFRAPLFEAALEHHRSQQLTAQLRGRAGDFARRRAFRAVVSRLAFFAFFFVSLLRGRALRFSAHTPAACTCSHAW